MTPGLDDGAAMRHEKSVHDEHSEPTLLEVVREALEPFAKALIPEDFPDTGWVFIDSMSSHVDPLDEPKAIQISAFRKAREALSLLAEIENSSSNASRAAQGTDSLAAPEGEEFLEFKEALSDLRSLRHEHECLNGGGPGWSARNAAAWAKVDELFANEDEAADQRRIEDFYG